ncbi:MAG: S-layer homology domain-containing protein [Syntrophomonas sp.]
MRVKNQVIMGKSSWRWRLCQYWRQRKLILLMLMVLFISACSMCYTPYANAETVPVESAIIKAGDSSGGDYFGASVSISGDYTIVGAYNKNSQQGKAYIFKRDGTAWSQQAVLTASDGAAGDLFGYSVSISGDYAVVGAYWKNSQQGKAYIFKRDGTAWTQQAVLTASDGAAGDDFGYSVSISGDYAVVGAYGKNSAYIFNRNGTAWTQQNALTASDGAAGDDFGCSVSIAGDYAVVGASSKNPKTGQAYIFNRNGAVWSQQAILTGSDVAGDDHFGNSVSIAGDYAIVGAENKNGYQGQAYIFSRNGAVWTQQAALTASDGAAYNLFGFSVSISGDHAVVGVSRNEGQVYMFNRNGAVWTEVALTGSDSVINDRFGLSVSISEDYVVVGAPWRNSHEGQAYIFDALAVSGIAIKTQPAKLAYVGGEPMDLTGLKATLTCSNSPAKDVDLADFARYRITVSPVAGTILGTAYNNKPVTVSCGGYSAPTNNLTVSPFATPSIQATAGDRHVNLTWNSIAGATGYKLYIGDTPGFSATGPVNKTVSGTVYDATGLTNGTTYYFAVRAYNAGGDGGLSSEASAKPYASITGVAVKNQPAKLAYVGGEPLDLMGMAATLEYSDSTHKEVDLSGFVGYGITASPAAGTILDTSYNNKPVTVNCGGYSAFTSNLTVGSFATPSIQSATAGDRHVNLTWNSITGAAGYKLYIGDTPGFSVIGSVYETVSGTVYDATGLTNGTTYYFAVRARNAGGDGGLSPEASATPYASIAGITVKNQPAKLAYVGGESLDLTGMTITLEYSDSTGKEIDLSGFAGYGITVSPVAGTILNASYNNTPVTVSRGVYSALTDNLTVSLLAAPSIQSATAGNRRVNLTWSSIGGATGYKLYIGDTPGFSVTGSVYETVSGTRYDATGLTNGKPYYFAVRAYNAGGDGGLSPEASATPHASEGDSGSDHTSTSGYCTVTAKESEGGTIVLGSIGVEKNGSVTFTVIPQEGYRIADVLVNGVAVGAVKSYTIQNITADITIQAVFERIKKQDAWENPFTDVSEDDWFYSSVAFVNQNGLFKGTGNLRFDPDSSMTRGMFVTALGRIASMGGKKLEISARNLFSDVKTDAYYADFVAWAYQNGIAYGTGNNLFEPDTPVTREQIMVMLYKYAKFAGIDMLEVKENAIGRYTDAGRISDWAKEEMNWAVSVGIIEGRDGNTLAPGDKATRAEVAAITERFIKRILKK